MANLVYFLAILSLGYVSAVLLSDDESEGFTRISNGNTPSETQFPYAVSVQSLQNNAQQQPARGHRCGGVLITLQHVLTTATCVTDVTNDGFVSVINAANYQVFAGSITLANSSSDRVRPIANFTVHPDFIRAPAYLNDVAVVTLNLPFASTTVTPLNLPTATYEPTDFTLCTVAGWGATSNATNAPMSPVLRYANKYIYNQNLCTSVYSNLAGLSNVFDTMVCAASFDIISTGCTGDSGNALVCNNTLTGLLFFHNGCTATSFPELYTRVSNYTTWIRTVTGSASAFTPGLFMLFLLTVSQIVFAKIVR